jgi:hypothetical protein
MTSGAEQQALDQPLGLARSTVGSKRHEGIRGTGRLHGGFGYVAVADHIEAAQIGRVLQLRQAVEHRGFGKVASLPGSLQQFTGWIGAGANERVRDKRWQNV